MKGFLACCIVGASLIACGKSDQHEEQRLPEISALPFNIEQVMFSDAFKGNLTVAQVNVDVNGGSRQEWAATAIAISEKVASFGANSIEVRVLNADIHQDQGWQFRELAHTFYSPDTKRTVWDNQPQWAIYTADPAHLVTQRDVDIYDEYTDQYEKLLAQGVPDDIADKRVFLAISRKYNLPKDWILPAGNINMTGSGIPRASLNVNSDAESISIAKLETCLDGRHIYSLTPCGGE